jgi:hypothetical protein
VGDEAVQGLHPDIHDIKFHGITILIETRAPYRVPFYPDIVGAHLLISRSAASVIEPFFQKFHKKVQGNLLDGFPSGILESAVLPPRVDLFLQGNDSVG